jgi:hypothetical protein
MGNGNGRVIIDQCMGFVDMNDEKLCFLEEGQESARFTPCHGYWMQTLQMMVGKLPRRVLTECAF